MRKTLLLFIGLWLGSGMWAPTAQAISWRAGSGLFRVLTANNVRKGDLWVGVNTSAYVQNVSGGGLLKDGRGQINLVYGSLGFLELGLGQVVYQDNPFVGTEITHGPLRASLKLALPSRTLRKFNVGLQLLAHLNDGGVSNVDWEEYYSSKTSYGAVGIFSYDFSPTQFGVSRRLHFNVGYFNHNDINAGPNYDATTKTTEVNFGVAYEHPIGAGNFFIELTGNHFLNINTGVTNNKDYAWLTPGVMYKLWGVDVKAGVDVALLNADSPTNPGLKMYPLWKLHGGFQVRLYERKLSERERLSIILQGEGGVFGDLRERQRRIEEAERELQEIRRERMQAERELEELRKLLGISPSAP